MDRTIEDRLVAMLEAVKAPLPRAQIFDRFNDDVDDEEALAKMLRRLVADGRLERLKRQAQGREEFVYGVHRGNVARVGAIAAAVDKVQQREDETVKEDSRDKYIELLESKRAWLAPKEVSGILLEHAATSGTKLRALAEAGRIQTKGERRGLRYAALGVPREVESSSPAKASPTAPKAAKKSAPRSPRSSKQDAAPRQPAQLPVATVPRGKLSWAITDTGMVAINDGRSTIQLAPADCEYGVGFLEKTQLLWRRAA